MLRSGFLTSAASRGASIFKMMDVSRHHSVDTLRGYVRDAGLFQNHAGRGPAGRSALIMRTIGRIGGAGYVRFTLLSWVRRGEHLFVPIRGLTYRSKAVQ